MVSEQHIIGVHTKDLRCNYSDWISSWTNHLSHQLSDVKVPPAARAVNTPLDASNWKKLLVDHPNRPLVNFFISGITEGFRIGFKEQSTPLKSAKQNLSCALQHPDTVENYLTEEIALGRVAGPFQKSSVPQAHVSRFGVIPKHHQPNKWRLIVDLSHPTSGSINAGIPKELCSLKYITVDSAIDQIKCTGRGALLAKIDIKSAFRLLPVHPADRHLLSMRWRKQIFVDTCLPFGLRSAPKLFNVLADLLSWVLEQQMVTPVLHYLDDFFTIGPQDSPSCASNLQRIKDTCSLLGIPLALEKVEGPSQSLTFLGISLNTQLMLARLPDEKLSRIRNQVSAWLSHRKATKRDILPLVGLLQHATKVVTPGRTFVSRMYRLAARLKKLSHFTRLTSGFRSDLRWWHLFITHWNGLSFINGSTPDYIIASDASGSWGCGAVFGSQWLQLAWSKDWAQIDIMAKELAPIVLSCAIWGPLLSGSRVEFHCDNSSVVDSITKGSSKEIMVMHLLRCLWFFSAHFDIKISACHIPGTSNTAADQLSRNRSTEFLKLHPHTYRSPASIPMSLLKLISPRRQDWTSPSFLRHFKRTINTLQGSPPARNKKSHT